MPAFVRLATLIVSVGAFLSVGAWPTAARADQPRCPGGELYIVDDQPPGPAGPPVCPLKGTDVAADVTGMFARVRVTQVFRNPLDRKIEAIYTFPLPADAAVDEMIMTVGARRVIGQVRPREEARAVYESAKAAGHVASLLDQERPNIFTQSVANIDPGAEVTIEISYVEVLKYDAGLYEWSFPMVVGPRYIPGGGSAPAPMTNATPTPQVPDANRISPPVTPPGTRAGHDIRVTVHIEGGMGLFDLKSELHEVDVAARDAQTASVSLKNKAEIPNRDFVLRYRLGGDQISDAFLAQRDPRGDFFTLILQPPRRVSNEAAVARELVFVLDTSGSMSGFPIEKAKAVMAKAIDALRPGDTFNLITFAGSTKVLWEHPRPATNENRAAAQEFLASRKGGGGTEMMKAIDAALNTGVISVEQAFRELRGETTLSDGVSTVKGGIHQPGIYGSTMSIRGRIYSASGAPREAQRSASADYSTPVLVSDDGRTALSLKLSSELTAIPADGTTVTVTGQGYFTEIGHLVSVREVRPAPIRVVCFMTDGYVGNDMAIIDAVKRFAATTRVFSFGIGNSVNRFLLDGMANAGRGEVEYVTLASDGDAAAARFAQRVQSPVLTDIAIDWGTLSVSDVYPKQIPDLFDAKPVVVHGRLTGSAFGTLTLRGNTGLGAFSRAVMVSPTTDSGPAPTEAALRDATLARTNAVASPLATLWARAKVTDLMNRDLAALQQGNFPEALKKEITELGVMYRLMTQFTSFVAVEEMTVTVAGEPTTVQVPVEMPSGVSYEGVFGSDSVLVGQMLRGVRAAGAAEVPAAAAPTAGFIGGAAARKAGRADGEKAAAPAVLGVVPREARDDDGDGAIDVGRQKQSKLAPPLDKLAERVGKDGKDGTLTVEAVRVVEWKVDVMILLRDTSAKTLAELKKLGFVQSGATTAATMVIGTLDVRKLEELSKLEFVIEVRPVPVK